MKINKMTVRIVTNVSTDIQVRKKQRGDFRPMKAQNYVETKVVYPCRMQFKLNGLRVEEDSGKFWSGDSVPWNDAVVAHIIVPLRKFYKKHPEWADVRPDGEFYRHGWSLQKINKNIGVGRLHATELTPEIKFYIFDRVTGGNFSNVRSKDYHRMFDRHEAELQSFNVERVPTFLVKNKKEADALYARAVKEGYEGVIYRMDATPKGVKLGRSPLNDKHKKELDLGYVQGGRPHWMLKRKVKFDAEFLIVEMLEGKLTDKGGKHVGRMGAVVCLTKDGKHRFHVGGGFDDKQRQKYWDERNNPKKTILRKMLRVEYGRLSDNGIPNEPRAFDGCIRDYA